MNALEELKIKLMLDRTPLDFSVLFCDEMGGEATAMDAAKELLDMRSCIESLEAANEKAREALGLVMGESRKLRRNFAKYLAEYYEDSPVEVAALCDEQLDRTGELLGYVREEAAALGGNK